MAKENQNQLSAIILAGGRATRLGGVDKGLANYRGKPLIEHVLTRLKPQVAEIIISANRNITQYQRYNHKVISDGNLDYAGPLTGINQCLPECKHDNILVCSCDMPLLPYNLIDYFDLNSPQAIQVITINGYRQLCWLMRASVQTSLQNYLKQGGQQVMQWVANSESVDIHIADENHSAFKNFNTPEDFIEN